MSSQRSLCNQPWDSSTLPLSLSITASVCLCLYLCLFLPVYISVCLCLCLYPSILYLSFCLSLTLPLFLSLCLSFLCLYLSLPLYIYAPHVSLLLLTITGPSLHSLGNGPQNIEVVHPEHVAGVLSDLPQLIGVHIVSDANSNNHGAHPSHFVGLWSYRIFLYHLYQIIEML